MSRTQAQYMRRMKKRARRKRALCLMVLGLAVLLSAVGSRLYQQKTEKDAEAVSVQCRLHGQTWYALRLGTFETEAEAEQQAAQFLARGAGSVIKRADGTFHLLAAAYETRADAVRVQENLSRFYNVESDVYVLSWGSADVMLHGTHKQTGALRGCYDLMNALGDTVSHLILQLDEGQLSRTDAEATVASCRESIGLLEKELLSAFAKDQNALSNHMADALYRIGQDFEHALQSPGDVRFGAYVKGAHLHWALAMQEHLMLLEGMLSSP